MAETFQLRMNQELAERIRRQGAETFPHECCGALLGRDSADPERVNPQEAQLEAQREVVKLFPVINGGDYSPPNLFGVPAEDVLDAERAARQYGLDVVGWY